MDRLAPAISPRPSAAACPIDYEGDHPAIEVRLQEMFGVTDHPVVGQRPPAAAGHAAVAGAAPDPGHAGPAALLGDLYADVRKDMRGQYPRHPWPEDPTEAADPARQAAWHMNPPRPRGQACPSSLPNIPGCARGWPLAPGWAGRPRPPVVPYSPRGKRFASSSTFRSMWLRM
jgi:hypothetical protein